ncbi:pleckstrin homology domain-containing family A member 8 isoform X1 [Cryptotermes secundus]|uniref:pleckstrin homology domain-containing family A member 8 isoform X1 n=1 Tax=Cryptotermes secundus TaxID=105785 RepID=UPI000CD7AC6C|nr:pleckstrin homology domain-containing family A member 8 isoform X1 [Cryptotermes secundus]XP_023716240.1 pleckstrin homology domain-containing family A member 8 isoform X1 [Cryptotermes secundus]
MSASNGGVRSEDEKNFFNSVQLPFPEVIDGKINTLQFLESSKGVVGLVEKFGKVFAPVKYDMTGNIEKLTEQYNTNKEKHLYLNNMILAEKEEGGNYAIDALLWLRRALQFIYTFFSCVLEDSQQGKKSEDLVPFLKKAYKETLEAYHGWMTQKLFGLLARMCPSRSELMITLALGRENHDEAVLREMAIFLTGLDSNIQVLIQLYLENGLESNSKV